jgi:hypothetical protein
VLVLEHDPKSGNRFSEKIMLQPDIQIMVRFNLIGSSLGFNVLLLRDDGQPGAMPATAQALAA